MPHTPTRPPRLKRSMRIGTIAASLLIGGSIVIAPAVSSAVTIQPMAVIGHGYQQIVDGKLAPLGSYQQDGVFLYCGEMHKIGPWTGTHKVGNQAWPGVSADDNARVSMVVETFGQRVVAATRENQNMHAAVQLYVWDKIDHADFVKDGGERGIVAQRAPADQHADILAKLQTIRNAAKDLTARPAVASGKIVPITDPATKQITKVRVEGLSPADATGTLTLDGAVFADTGTKTITGVVNGQTLDVRQMLPDDAADYTVKVSGDFFIKDKTAYQGQIGYWESGTDEQKTVGPGPKAPTRFALNAQQQVSSIFSPVAGTQVASTYVKKGQQFQDQWKFGVASGSQPWRQLADGSYLPVTAKGTLYGPFQARPAEAEQPPANAPVASHATVTTDPKTGPTGEYTATGDETAKEGGYYTWVVGIDQADQSERTAKNIPAGYAWNDRFGQVAETHIVPSAIRFNTSLDKNQVEIGGTFTDTITPSVHDGTWIRDDEGKRVAVKLRGVAYWTPEKPAVSDTVPKDAEPIQTQYATLTDVEPVDAEPLTLPKDKTSGFVSLRWCIDDRTKQFGQMVEAFCDQFGLPSETVEIVPPTITTKAQPTAQASAGDTVQDNAHVTGPIPADGLDTTFEGFLQPAHITKAEQITPETAVCTPGNRIFTSSKTTVITKAGVHPSEKFKTDGVLPDNRVIAWVETSKVGGTDHQVSKGVCGDVAELTSSHKPAPTPTELAFTGSGPMTPWLIGGGIAALTGIAIYAGLLIRRRRDQIAPVDETPSAA